MKFLSLILFALSSLPLGAAPVEETIDRLPEIRDQALQETTEWRAGSRTEMIDAAEILRDRLLPSIVSLESRLLDEKEETTRAKIERDLEAIARDAEIRGHAEGWGGNLVTLDSAWTVVEHLEARASWSVWQLMKDDDRFNFSAWKRRWTRTPGSGDTRDSAEEKTEKN